MPAAIALTVVGAAALAARLDGNTSGTGSPAEGTDGRDLRERPSLRPTIKAAFAAESYRRGATAELIVFDRATTVQLRLHRVGDSVGTAGARDEMRGTPVGGTRSFARVRKGQTVRLPLDARWPSGLYYAELSAPGGRIGYAPFVLAPQKLGGHRIAVVLPTQTWQAYNFSDDDGDGTADTWYASPDQSKARLFRPFENRGIPPHYHAYDEPFLRWLAHREYAVDFLSDAELRRVEGSTLARAYELLIFEGHHEYVTEREVDAVTGFRDRGGNLMFLSANNFFRKITIADGVMTIVGQWRKLGRPEATLVGARYFSSHSEGHGSSPWVVRHSAAGEWIFRGTGLEPGSLFASGGIEVDSTSQASPRGIQVVAEIPNVFGDGRNAQMTYYEAPSGARVFAAGAFTLAGSVWQPPVQQMMTNLIAELSVPAGEAPASG
jgi:hypothetical protein